MTTPSAAPAATFVIFGALGDLTKRLLAPALANLARDGLLDQGTKIIGVSYHDEDDASLRKTMGAMVEESDAGWQTLADATTYLRGDFTDAGTYRALKDRLQGNAVFYLATAPNFFGPIVTALSDAGLFDEKDGFRRVVVEKPFGTDIDSAHALNEQILTRIGENQVYRIDHFLGKETVQNIMVLRFGNPLMEATWNNRYIDHVQITAAEQVTVGTRGKFYDATGALRDMVPNHLFQLLAMVGMEPPNSFDADAIRTEKAKVVGAIRLAGDVTDAAVRGQYQAGEIDGKAVPAYPAEDQVAADSRTETYAAVKVTVETWRWAGVPFYLRTGKSLAKRDTEIVVQFKDVPLCLFRETDCGAIPPNRLVLQIQPDEGLTFEMVAKNPGPLIEAEPVAMTFRYADRFKLGHRTGYETLLYDVLIGDQTLFQRADQIEAGWRVVQPILEAWREGRPEGYKAGTSGPAGADALLERDGRAWHQLG